MYIKVLKKSAEVQNINSQLALFCYICLINLKFVKFVGHISKKLMQVLSLCLSTLISMQLSSVLEYFVRNLRKLALLVPRVKYFNSQCSQQTNKRV
jgi:hypothetical protein